MYKFNDLIITLQESIFTWDYFTDFVKVILNVKKVEVELNILNYLIGKEDIENEFISLIDKYPNIRKALPLLIAVRRDKLKEMPIITGIEELTPKVKEYIFFAELTKEINDELLVFFNNTGLKSIFIDKNIKNLTDYCFGVEVGLDTNTRKNRTGTLMENMVAEYLIKFCRKNSEYKFIKQVTQKRIKEIFNIDVKMDKNNRRFDFALFNCKIQKIYLFEVNYYSSGGSKLKATAGEYQYLEDFLKEQDIDFIWITDGKGWLTALHPLEETFNHNRYVINLDMLQKNALYSILNIK